MATLLKFKYINHRGEDHEYILEPTDFLFIGIFSSKNPEREGWSIIGKVIKRDDQYRGVIRSFAITKMRDIEELERL
jgi:hypothetical protein